MKRLALSLLTALVMLCALVGALAVLRPLNTLAALARTDALRALIEPFAITLQQQVPVTLTVQLPDSGETLSLPVLLDVNVTIGMSSTLTTTITVPTPTPVATPRFAHPDLSHRLDGLAALDSYRLYSYMAVQGRTETQDVDTWIEAEAEVDNTFEALHVLLGWQGGTFMDLDENQAEYEVIRIGSFVWLGKNGVWTTDADRADDILEMTELGTNATILMDGVTRFTVVSESEMLNGIDTAHYAFGLKDLNKDDAEGIGDVDSLEGHVWLAHDGGYIVRFTLQVTGPGIEVDGPMDGTIELLYEVTDINEPVTIEPPEMGPESNRLLGFEETGFPMPDDAEVGLAEPELLSYLTSAPVSAMVEFYQDALAALDWQVDEPTTGRDSTELVAHHDGWRLDMVIARERAAQTRVTAGVRDE